MPGRLLGGQPEMLETIVLRTGRPVLAIAHDKPQLVFEEAESTVWKGRLLAAEKGLVRAIKAVGRIELRGHRDFEWVGTGWLVSNDVVVTNRHVAVIFGRSNGREFVFREGISGALMEASIDFLQEAGRPDSRKFKIEHIMHIEGESGPDMAFLRVRREGSEAEPITFEQEMPEPGRFVAVIGYPARDSRIPDEALMDRIFGDIYNKKRLAPGQISRSEDGLVLHDCSTLGGNSGSVVLDLRTGHALGLHFSGRYLQANYAVPADPIVKRLEALKSRSHRANLGKSGTPAEAESDLVLAEAAPVDYSNRKGYDQDFLGKKARVALPVVTHEEDSLNFEYDGKRTNVLRYEHFSVVMNRTRRMCYFSAVNIDGRTPRKMARRGWRFDTRIPKRSQIMAECYGNPPRFSRGHMTRREDPIWGTKSQASLGNDDSMHATNAVPQMQPFNAPIWLGLEDYALEHAREDDMKVSVITGPVLLSTDPERFNVKVPRSFWKVIAFIHDKTRELCATGYTMSQDEFLGDEEFVFGQFTTPQHKTTQVPLASIEKKAGLSFGNLRDHDPLDRIEGPAETPLSDFGQIRFT